MAYLDLIVLFVKVGQVGQALSLRRPLRPPTRRRRANFLEGVRPCLQSTVKSRPSWSPRRTTSYCGCCPKPRPSRLRIASAWESARWRTASRLLLALVEAAYAATKPPGTRKRGTISQENALARGGTRAARRDGTRSIPEFERGLPTRPTGTPGCRGSKFLGSSRSGKGVRSKVRVLRGGSFNNDTRNLRAANRNRNAPGNRNNNIGFRCIRDVERSRASASAARAAVVTAAAGVRALPRDRAPGERRAAFGAEQQKGPGPLVAQSETRPGPSMR